MKSAQATFEIDDALNNQAGNAGFWLGNRHIGNKSPGNRPTEDGRFCPALHRAADGLIKKDDRNVL